LIQRDVKKIQIFINKKVMKIIIKILSLLFTLVYATAIIAEDGTNNWQIPFSEPDQSYGSCIQVIDEVWELTPFESVSICPAQTWTDNRHRAYYNTNWLNVNGFLLFDVSAIPDDAVVTEMTLRCYLENDYGSPYSNPVVDIYWSDDDGWTRSSVTPNQLSLNDLVVNDIPFIQYVPTYDFQIDMGAHDWSIDLADNRICLGFKNDVNYYSYVYFFGAYGTPTGPPPVLTITTILGTPQIVDVVLTPYETPIQIPANGGSFEFNIEVINNEITPVNCNVWTMITLPVGNEYGPVINVPLFLSAGFSGDRDKMQAVPANAPSGNYVYHAYVGYYPNVVWSEDQFGFEKLAVEE